MQVSSGSKKTNSDSKPTKSNFSSANRNTEHSEQNSNDDKEGRILESVSKLLSDIIDDNSKISNLNTDLVEVLAPFTYKKPPAMSIQAYIERIFKYTKMESSTLVLFLILLDRVCEKKNITLTKYNIHRLIMSSVLTAIKFNEDDFYSNSFYSRVGGISLQEMNAIESEFIKLSEFDLFVDEGTYEKYTTYLNAYLI